MLIQLEHKFRSLLKDPFFFFVVIHSHLPIADGQEETSGWRTWVGINEVGKYLFSFSNPTAAGKRKSNARDQYTIHRSHSLVYSIGSAQPTDRCRWINLTTREPVNRLAPPRGFPSVGGAPAKKDCGTGSKEGRRSKKGKRRRSRIIEAGRNKM